MPFSRMREKVGEARMRVFFLAKLPKVAFRHL
jgi:hypothetical protein